MTFDLPLEMYESLARKGTAYLRILDIPTSDIPDCLQEAFFRLIKCAETHQTQDFPELCLRFWREAIYRSAMDIFRDMSKQRSILEEGGDISEEGGLFFDLLPLFSDPELFLIAWLLDHEEHSCRKAAKDLGVSHMQISRLLSSIREKAAPYFVTYTKESKALFTQPYIEKSSDFSRFLMAVEVVEYIDTTNWSYDPQEDEKCRSIKSQS